MAKPSLFLACLWTFVSLAVQAHASNARLLVKEAEKLVEAAIYPNRGQAVLQELRIPEEPDFIFFEAIDPNPDHSAHMGTFAVNSWTGDVWSTAGFCIRVSSPRLTEMLKSIQSHSPLKATELDRLGVKKPICDAN
jgi:hypothetical protein